MIGRGGRPNCSGQFRQRHKLVKAPYYSTENRCSRYANSATSQIVSGRARSRSASSRSSMHRARIVRCGQPPARSTEGARWITVTGRAIVVITTDDAKDAVALIPTLAAQ